MIRLYFIGLIIILPCFTNLAGQTCCPWINSTQIIPSNPTSADTIRVVANVSTPSQGGLVSAYANVQGLTVLVQTCYYSGMLPAIGTYIDTITIGLLPAGSYMLDFNARLSIDANNCAPVDSTNSITPFTVSSIGPPRACCIVADSAQTSPAILPPFPDSSGLLIGYVTLPALGNLLSHNLQINQTQHQLTLEVCYYSGNTANPNSVSDTFSIGSALQPGLYQGKFIAVQSANPSTCSPFSTDTLNWNFFVDTTGTASIPLTDERFQLEVFPNPANNQFHISWNGQRILKLTAYDQTGKPFRALIIEPGGGVIDCSDWPAGTYLLYGNEFWGKLIIRK
jgi:hypothetical protein